MSRKIFGPLFAFLLALLFSFGPFLHALQVDSTVPCQTREEKPPRPKTQCSCCAANNAKPEKECHSPQDSSEHHSEDCPLCRFFLGIDVQFDLPLSLNVTAIELPEYIAKTFRPILANPLFVFDQPSRAPPAIS